MISAWGASASKSSSNRRRKSEKRRSRQKKKSEFHFRSQKKHHERREKDYIVELSESMSQNNHDAIKCFGWATLIVNHIIATLNQNEKYETHSSNAFVEHTSQTSLYGACSHFQSASSRNHSDEICLSQALYRSYSM